LFGLEDRFAPVHLVPSKAQLDECAFFFLVFSPTGK
jgi:hypothetical protein